MKRLLLVSHVFPPMVSGGAPRVSQFAKYLPEFDWATTVLTVPCAPGAAVDEETLRELPGEVEIVRAFSPLERAGSRGRPNPRRGIAALRRAGARWLMKMACTPDRQIFWYPFAVRAGRELLTRQPFDAILATYGPGTNLVIGERLAKISGVPLVVDFRDLWSDYPGARWPTPLHRRNAERLERRASRQAKKIIAVSPRMARHLAAKHGREERDVISITNGFDPADLPRAVDLRSGDAGRPFRLCYTGSVYGAYDFGPLLQAMRDLAGEQVISPENFRLQFVGNFSPDEAAHWGVGEFVDVAPPVAHSQVFNYLGQADALVMLEGPGYWAEFSYAVKIFDYALTGKPILALVEGEGHSAALVRELGVGEIVAPRDRAQIAAALRRLLEQKNHPAGAVDIARPPLCRFDRRNLTEQLAAVLDAACGKSPIKHPAPGEPVGLRGSR